MADDDWDEEELLMVTGRSTKAGKKRSRKASESDDDEQPARAQKATGAKRRAPAAAAAGDSDEDSEDGMDAEERRKLEAMNELEREMYLFEREEKLQRERERKQVLSQARRDEQVEVRASSRRPRAQTGTDSAIGKIAAAVAQREAREKKKQQEEEEKQEKQQRARPSKKQQQQEEEEEADEEDAEVSAEEDEEMEEADEEDELAALDEEDDDELLAADKQQQLVRAEEYDEGAGYEESEEVASIEEVRSIQLKRSDLEAWHNEPFFEDDVRGCVLRLSVPPTAEQQRAGQAQQTYLLVKVVDVVSRNSYAFGKPGARTRKWLHLDDLSGNPVFRYQMSMVSNQEVADIEYQKSYERAKRNNGKFITKGDIQLARQHLQHARTFKYNPELVKKMLEKKRAAGRMTGSSAQVRARLRHEINLARQEGKPEEQVQRLQEELDRLEQQEQRKQQEVEELIAAASKDRDGAATAAASAVASSSQQGGKFSSDMALALINMRNRDKNNFKVLGPTAGMKKQAASGEANSTDVFSRRHTQSRVYWATSKKQDGDGGSAAQQGDGSGGGQLLRQGSGATDVTLLKASLKKLEPSELIKVLDLQLDLARLPVNEPGALLSKRLLGLRWFQSVERRQQEMAGRSLLTLDDWKRKMSYQQMM